MSDDVVIRHLVLTESEYAELIAWLVESHLSALAAMRAAMRDHTKVTARTDAREEMAKEDARYERIMHLLLHRD